MILKEALLILITLLLLQVSNAAAYNYSLDISNFNLTLKNQVINNNTIWNKTVQLINAYNNYFTSMPDIVKSTIGTEIIRANLTFLNDAKMTVGLRTDNGLIREYQITPYNDSTMALYLSEKGVLDILSEKDPFKALQGAWGTEIRFEGLTLLR